MAIGLGCGAEPSPGLQRDDEPRHLRAAGDECLMENTLSGKEFHVSLVLS